MGRNYEDVRILLPDFIVGQNTPSIIGIEVKRGQDPALLQAAKKVLIANGFKVWQATTFYGDPCLHAQDSR